MSYYGCYQGSNSIDVYAKKSAAIRDIKNMAYGQSADPVKWYVWDEKNVIVAAGYMYKGRNHNTPEVIGRLISYK